MALDDFFSAVEGQRSPPAAARQTPQSVPYNAAMGDTLNSLFPSAAVYGRPRASGPNQAPDPLANPSSAMPASSFAQRQNDPLSCGQTSAAMSINMLTGKSMTDKTFGEKYGYSLYQGLVEETSKEGYKWNPYETNFDPGKWDIIDKKTNLEGFPVMIGLNGPEFSASGRGHIVTLVGTRGNEVTYLDPADGSTKTTTRKAIEDAPAHPDGKFLFYPEQGPARKGKKSDLERLTVRGRSDVIAQAHGLSPSISAAQWMQESGMKAYDNKGNILTSSAGALGVSQMLPETIKEVADRHNLKAESFYTGGPTAQMKFGALYMEDLLTKPGYADITGGSYARALAAYNGGIGNVERWKKGEPVYEETKNYVANILTNSTGRHVSPDEAEDLIRSGEGPKYDPKPREERFINDKQNFFDFIGNFGNAMAGVDAKSNATDDLVEGGREFVSGMTFGISELIPGFRPTGVWDNLKGGGLAGDLALEIPHFAGMAFITELLGGAVGARALGTTARTTPGVEGTIQMGKAFDTAPFLGFGPKIPNIATPKLMEMPWASRYQTMYMNRIATAKGPMGTFGRLLLGRESQVVTDALAYGSIFGIQASTERFVEGMLANENAADIIPEALSHGFQAAMLGTALGVGVPFVLSSAGVGLAQGAKAFPEMAAAVEGAHPLFKGVGAAGITAAGMSVMGMDTEQGLVPASVGIAAALMSRGAPLEALGALMKSGSNTLVKSVVPEATRAKITEGVKGWFRGLEQWHQDLISGSFANTVGEQTGALNATHALIRIQEAAAHFEGSAARMKVNTADPLRNLVKSVTTQEAEKVQQLQQMQQELQRVDNALSGMGNVQKVGADSTGSVPDNLYIAEGGTYPAGRAASGSIEATNVSRHDLQQSKLPAYGAAHSVSNKPPAGPSGLLSGMKQYQEGARIPAEAASGGPEATLIGGGKPRPVPVGLGATQGVEATPLNIPVVGRTTLDAWDRGVKEVSLLDGQIQKLRVNPADPSVPIPQGTDPAKHLQSLVNQRNATEKQLGQLAKDYPALQVRDSFQRQVAAIQDDLAAMRASATFKQKGELTNVLQLSDSQVEQFTKMSDEYKNLTPGQQPKLHQLENLDHLNDHGRIDAMGRGIKQYVDSPVRMAAEHLDFLGERNLRQIAPELKPLEIAKEIENEARRSRSSSLLSTSPMSQKEMRESIIPWKAVAAKRGGVQVDGPTIISHLLRQGDSRVAMDGAIDPAVQAVRRDLSKVPATKGGMKKYDRPFIGVGNDGKIRISDKDLINLRTAVDLGQTKVPAAIHPTQKADLRKLLRAEGRARSAEVRKEAKTQIKALKKIDKINKKGEVPGDELLSAVRTPSLANAQNMIVQRAAQKNQSTVQEEIQNYHQIPADVRSQMEKDEIGRLNDLWTGNYSPSVLKEEMFKEPLKDVLLKMESTGETERINGFIRGAIDADNASNLAMAEEVIALSGPIPWQEAKGYAQNVMVEAMANGMNMGRYSGEAALRVVDTHMDDAIKAIGATDETARHGLIRRFTNAVRDDAEMGKLLHDHPEMAKPLAGYLQIRKLLDMSGHFTPAYKAATEANEMLMSFPELINHARGLGWDKESYSFLNSARERIKKHGSWSQVEKAHKVAVEAVNKKGFNVEKWHQMSEERQLKELYGDISQMKEAEQALAREDHRRLNMDLMLSTPIISPGQLVRNKIVSLFSGDRLNVALKNLHQVNVATGVAETPAARMVVFADQVTEGAMDASAQVKPPQAMSRLRNTQPGLVGRVMGVKGNTEATNYVSLEGVVGKGDMMIKHPSTGKLIPSKEVFLHPDAADFLGRYLSTTESSNIGKVWEDLNSIIRSSALMGSPSHHFMNIVTTQIANMITDPGKAMGLIPMGFKMLAGADGPALTMNAVRNGLNLRTMEQATRLVSKDIAGAFGEEMADQMYGTKQGLFRTMASAVNPMDPHSEMSFESLNWVGKAAVGIPRGFLKFDLAMNRKMLFDSIEAGMVSGFYHRTAKMAAKMEGQLEHLPPLARQRQLYQAAADTTNMLNGAVPHWWHTDKLRKAVYGTMITPSWMMSKAQGFVAALEPALGITSANGRFSHLPEALRQQMYKDMQKTVVAGMAAFIGASQVMSYVMNGHSTFADPDPKKWFHVRVGETYYTSPLFGYFRDVSKMLIGSAGEGTVEPFFETMMKQLGPAQKVIVAEIQNKDPRTGEAIRGPGGTGVVRQIMDSMGYASNEFTNFEELSGTTSSATLANLVGLGQDGATKRLSGKQWFLRQFGVWDSDYEYPRVYRAQLEDKIQFYSKQLDKRVDGYIDAAFATKDPVKRQQYMRQAAMAAFDEGVKVDNKQVAQILPNGLLKMTPERFEKMINAKVNPMGSALQGLNETDPVYLPLIQMARQRQQLERDRYMRRMSDPEYKP